jgi:hypothetical protein
MARGVEFEIFIKKQIVVDLWNVDDLIDENEFDFVRYINNFSKKCR